MTTDPSNKIIIYQKGAILRQTLPMRRRGF